MNLSVSQNVRTVSLITLGVLGGAALATVVSFSIIRPNNDSEESVAKSPALSTDGNAIRDGESPRYDAGTTIVVGGLDDLAAIESTFERTYQLHGLLLAADENQLNNYLTESSDFESPTLREQVQSAVVQRLAELDPRSTLNAIAKLPDGQGQSLIAVVFGEWSVQDLDGALVRAKSLSESERLTALDGILTNRGDLSDSLQQQIARELGHEQYAMQAQSSGRSPHLVEIPGKRGTH